MAEPPPQPPGEEAERSGPPEAYRFPGYRVTANLRRTRAGHWLRARQERIGRDVLVKAAPRGDARAVRELEREVELLGRVRSENLITLYDFRSEGSVAYAVYELPGERTLDRAVQEAEGSLPIPQAAAAGRQIAETLQALHRSGIWLRQAAPQDFFLDDSGRVRLASLEGAEPGGAPPGERSPLWLAPGEPGPAGDLFLLGLHLIFLLGGKVPAPHGVIELPGKWIDLVSRRLARHAPPRRAGGEKGPPPAEAALSLIRRLIAAPGSGPEPQVERAIAALAALEAGKGRDLPLAPSKKWKRALPVAAAVILGLLAGAWAWKTLAPGPRPPAEREVAAGGSAADPGKPGEPVPAADPAPEAAPAAPQPAAEAPAVPAPEPGAKNGIAGAGGEQPAAPADPGPPRPVLEPPSAPIPLIEPAPLPTPAELFLARAHRDLLRAAAAADGELESLWKEGVELARRQPDQGEAQKLGEVLVRIGGEIEERSRRRALLAGEVLGLDRDSFRVRYDFSSRRQLRDWTAAAAGGRVAILEGRLVALGKVVFAPGRYLRDRVRLEWRIPAGGRHPLRPNINVILWGTEEEGALAAETPPPPVLFGIGSYFGGGVLRLPGEDSRDVRLPAAVVVELSGPEPGEGAALWAAAAGRGAGDVRAERFELEWSAGGIRWLEEGKSLLPDPVPKPVLERLAPLDGRRGTVAWFTADSQLEVEEIIIEGALDAERLRAEALEASAARLRAALENR